MHSPESDRRIDYIEFGAIDLESIRRFYERAFGWKFQEWGAEYISFDDGRLTGGFTTRTRPQAGGPLVILYGTDIEKAQRDVDGAEER